MRIAMVSEHASPLAALGGADAGGQNVHVAALAEAVARRGAEVVVHTRRDDPSPPTWVEMAPGVTVHHVEAGPAEQVPKDELLPYMTEFGRRLASAWREWRPDVVHSHFWMSAHAALMAAQPMGLPLVHTFHALGVVKRRYQGEKDTSPGPRLEIERHVVRRADRIVSTSTDEVFELLRLGAEGERLTVIPCGVDLELFTPAGPSEPRRPGTRRVVSLGRFVERKGFGNVVEALADVPETELVLAGGPEAAGLGRDAEARRISEIARRCGVADRVTLRGRIGREEVARLIRSADAVVCAPWYEPFGIVPLETMACGVPVVASAVGGMIDSVVDGVTGVHVPPRDPGLLAAALRSLLGDEDRRRAYGEAGIRRARRLYDWNRIGAATLDVYARVSRRRRARAARNGDQRYELVAPGKEHVAALAESLSRLQVHVDRFEAWGQRLAELLAGGRRLLAVGNGGSAAQAQHLTAELVGRFETERQPLSAICLHADTSTLTAIVNDYGPKEAFARQVRAHGREGDVLLALSTSGRSENVLAAVRAAKAVGLETWGLTGGGPNPLADLCDDAIELDAGSTATTQELHLVAAHVVCGAVDRELALSGRFQRNERGALT